MSTESRISETLNAWSKLEAPKASQSENKAYFLNVKETGNKSAKFAYTITDENGTVISTRNSNREYVAATIYGTFYFGRLDLIGKGDHAKSVRRYQAEGKEPQPIAYLISNNNSQNLKTETMSTETNAPEVTEAATVAEAPKGKKVVVAKKATQKETKAKKAAPKKAAKKAAPVKKEVAKVKAKKAPETGTGLIAQILALHKSGKSNVEIVAAGFNRSTVYNQVGKFKKAKEAAKASRAKAKA